MHLRLGILRIAAMLLLYGALVTACNSDGEEAGNSGNGKSGGDGGTPGSGSATLTIGDESWSFDKVLCGFSQEETFLPQQSFVLSAFGETAEGVRIELSVAILDDQNTGRYEGDGVSFGVFLNDGEDGDDHTLNWVSQIGLFGDVEPGIQVDGKNVVADMPFQDHVNITGEKIPGTLQALCP